jgi:hypothetical protein
VIAAIVMFDPNGHGVGNFTNEQKAGSWPEWVKNPSRCGTTVCSSTAQGPFMRTKPNHRSCEIKPDIPQIVRNMPISKLWDKGKRAYR